MAIKIIETKNKIRMVSKKQPKSLLAPIPAVIRDIMELKHGDNFNWEIYQNEKGKFIQINVNK